MRTIWKGAISFGLVHIPVKLYPATTNNDLKLAISMRNAARLSITGILPALPDRGAP